MLEQCGVTTPSEIRSLGRETQGSVSDVGHVWAFIHTYPRKTMFNKSVARRNMKSFEVVSFIHSSIRRRVYMYNTTLEQKKEDVETEKESIVNVGRWDGE